MTEDPFTPEPIRQRVRAALGRTYRRRRARENALMRRWIAEQKNHVHTPVTVTVVAGETDRGTVLDDITERRCTSCFAFAGFAS